MVGENIGLPAQAIASRTGVAIGAAAIAAGVEAEVAGDVERRRIRAGDHMAACSKAARADEARPAFAASRQERVADIDCRSGQGLKPGTTAGAVATDIAVSAVSGSGCEQGRDVERSARAALDIDEAAGRIAAPGRSEAAAGRRVEQCLSFHVDAGGRAAKGDDDVAAASVAAGRISANFVEALAAASEGIHDQVAVDQDGGCIAAGQLHLSAGTGSAANSPEPPNPLASSVRSPPVSPLPKVRALPLPPRLSTNIWPPVPLPPVMLQAEHSPLDPP